MAERVSALKTEHLILREHFSVGVQKEWTILLYNLGQIYCLLHICSAMLACQGKCFLAFGQIKER